MRRVLPVIALSTLLAASWAPSAVDADENKTRARDEARKDDIRPHPGRLIESSWLIDRPVRTRDGKKIGTVENVWFDPKDGRVKEVVVDVDKNLLGDDEHRLVAWKDLNIAWDDQRLVVFMDQEVLKNAPKYKSR